MPGGGSDKICGAAKPGGNKFDLSKNFKNNKQFLVDGSGEELI
jgi:hypothetical protein